jgi:ankyrin repeat protein
MNHDADLIRQFVLAGHFDLDKVKTLLAEHPALLNEVYYWSETDRESALQAAGHVGNRPIAEFLLSQGAPLEIGVAAMLGNHAEVEAMLKQQAALVDGIVVHGFRALYHAALSGEVTLLELFQRYGCTQDYNQALHAAVSKGHLAAVTWLLANGVTDPNTPNYQGKTPLKQALERDYVEVAALLRAHGAQE